MRLGERRRWHTIRFTGENRRTGRSGGGFRAGPTRGGSRQRVGAGCGRGSCGSGLTLFVLRIRVEQRLPIVVAAIVVVLRLILRFGGGLRRLASVVLSGAHLARSLLLLSASRGGVGPVGGVQRRRSTGAQRRCIGVEHLHLAGIVGAGLLLGLGEAGGVGRVAVGVHVLELLAQRERSDLEEVRKVVDDEPHLSGDDVVVTGDEFEGAVTPKVQEIRVTDQSSSADVDQRRARHDALLEEDTLAHTGREVGHRLKVIALAAQTLEGAAGVGTHLTA
mmetsp:Transcript_15361/g.39159  ORF Transcript_15361/g.39159 Transcript_15361/m.39159 type:complete len:277 (+) Transcript_15361:90-920(+)